MDKGRKRSLANKKKNALLSVPMSGQLLTGWAKVSSRSELRRHLDERLRSLHRRAILLEKKLGLIDDRRFYRTCIFGSASIKPHSKLYKDTTLIARYLAGAGIDILTGGGPGLMEAANKGAQLGRQEMHTKSLSFGISITLPTEQDANTHLDIRRHHFKFSSRLDDFMRLSQSAVVMPGGVGTVLELVFNWQLVQRGHLSRRPIVLINKSFWHGFLDWMRASPLESKMMIANDFDFLHLVDTPEEVAEIIKKHQKTFLSVTSH